MRGDVTYLMCARTICSNAFMATNVRAIGLESLRPDILAVLGIGMIVPFIYQGESHRNKWSSGCLASLHIPFCGNEASHTRLSS